MKKNPINLCGTTKDGHILKIPIDRITLRQFL